MLETELKEKLWAAEEEIASWAEEISTEIFNHPELGDEEHFAAGYLTEQIKKMGFEVTFPYIPDAFKPYHGSEHRGAGHDGFSL